MKTIHIANRLLVILLCLSVLINLIIGGGLLYLKFVKYPAYYRNTVKLLDKLPVSSKGIIFIGDSFVQGYNWQDLNSRFGLLNYGLGGTKVEDWAKKAEELSLLKPDTVFFWLGINNLMGNDTPENIAQSFQQLVSLPVFSNKTLFILEVLPVNQTASKAYLSVNKKIAELNLLIRKFDRVNFLPIGDIFQTTEGLNSNFSDDGLHLNALGYEFAERYILYHLSKN